MAHFRRAVGAALVLNTSLCAVEMAGGVQAHSLSLLTDGIHNCSDELALGCLYLAFYLPGYLGRHSQRTANVLNSLGLIVLSAFMIAQAGVRLLHATPVQAFIPIVIGLAAAAGNYGVAVLLRRPAQHNTAVRLAYVHNMGDVLVSLAPVSAGALVALIGRPEADGLVAVAIALWLIVTTVREVRSAADDLLWPEELVCAHPEAEAPLAMSR
ncbi:MAG TPA: cation transporter [Candidatus Acidoferrales bacterium]|nr:cation transporter [Candidatus Acidoferrales bacterium]